MVANERFLARLEMPPKVGATSAPRVPAAKYDFLTADG